LSLEFVSNPGFNFCGYCINRIDMAHTKQGKTTKGSRQPNPKYLGVKLFGGQVAGPGNIIIRQKGTKYHPGAGVKLGRDYTIFAIQEGVVSFKKKLDKMYVSVS
jgi:large subunit ribosomal protein L27